MTDEVENTLTLLRSYTSSVPFGDTFFSALRAAFGGCAMHAPAGAVLKEKALGKINGHLSNRWRVRPFPAGEIGAPVGKKCGWS